MEKETWKTMFCRQVGSGSFWRDLLKDDFDKRGFLDRSDAVYICKLAQADAYESIIKKFKKKVDPVVINEIDKIIKELWTTDDSALGMNINRKKIK